MEPVTTGLFESYGTGYGTPEIIPVASPAAGADASLVVSKAGYYRPMSVACTFTASANAANRFLEVQYVTDGGLVWCRNGGAPLIVASEVWNVCWNIGWGESDFASSGSSRTSLVYPLAPLFVPQGHTIKIHVGAIDGSDALTAIAVYVEEFDVGPRGYPVGRQAG